MGIVRYRSRRDHYAAVYDYGAAYMARFAKRDHCLRGQSDVERRE